MHLDRGHCLGQWTIQMWLWPDISIFQGYLLSHLELNECVEADDGFIGEHPRHIKCPKSVANSCETKHIQQHVRNWQELINNHFKFWGIVKPVVWHEIPRHGDAFHAITVIYQLSHKLTSLATNKKM